MAPAHIRHLTGADTLPAGIDPAALYVAHGDAMESRLGDETVILHLGSGTYFGLDAVGTLIWGRLIGPGGRLDDFCADIVATFPDAPENPEGDVTRFMAQLAEHGLIRKA